MWKAAKELSRNGFSIIPLEFKGKKPLISWLDYQEVIATEEEIEEWFKDKEVNIAIICGEVSGNLLVIDFDDNETFKKCFDINDLLEKTMVVKTGRGWHVYFRTAEPVNIAPITQKVTVKGEAGYVVAPPSIHETGKQYKWLGSGEIGELKDVDGLIDFIREQVTEKRELELVKEEFSEYKPLRLGRKVPYCVKLILEGGVEEGERNERAFDLARYFYCKGNTSKEMLEKLKEWNEKNEIRLHTSELETISDSVFNKGYVFACARIKNTDWCHKNACHYHKNPEKKLSGSTEKHLEDELEKKEENFSEDIIEEAKKLIGNPNILKEVYKIISRNIVGEDKTKLLIFLLGLSGKTPFKQIIMVKGESSAGKTWVLKHASLKFNKTKKIGRMSHKAIDYMKDLNEFDILYIQEYDNVEEIKHLRLLSADDEGLLIEVVIKDKKTGEFTTQVMKKDPICIMSSTTAVQIDPEMETRSWIVTVDLSDIQTERVRKYLNDDEFISLLKTFHVINDKRDVEIVKCAISMLKRYDNIVIPYSHALDDKRIIPLTIRSRRDYEKFKELIKLCAFLHQANRPTFELNGNGVLYCAIEDAYISYAIAKESLFETTSGMEKRIQEASVIAREILINKEKEYLEILDIAREMNLSGSSVRKYLKRLCENGALNEITHPDDRRRNAYVVGIEEKLEKTFEDVDFSFEELRDSAIKFMAKVNQYVGGDLEKFHFKEDEEEIRSKIKTLFKLPFSGDVLKLYDVA